MPVRSWELAFGVARIMIRVIREKESSNLIVA
jgi:hypothetical protein